MKVTVEEILTFLKNSGIDVSYSGTKEMDVSYFCSLKNPKSNSITWVKNPSADALKNFSDHHDCVIVCAKEIPNEINNVAFIITDKPKAVFFSILSEFWSGKNSIGVGKTSVVLTKDIGENVSIGEHCYIGEDVVIGNNVVIEHNVSIINRVVIGDDCIIHSGVVIGTDGFGYFKNVDGNPEKVEHFGGVQIGNNVEIGANTCIDRGTIDDTTIGDFVKVDNLVQIAHNVTIGKRVLVTAGTLFGGSSTIGDDVYVAPGVIVKNQLSVGEKSLLGMGAVVNKSVDCDRVVKGIDAGITNLSAHAFMKLFASYGISKV